MKTNKFRITQWGDYNFTIERLYIIPQETWANLFRKVKKTEEDWRIVYDASQSSRYHYKRWTSLKEAQDYIDKTILDEGIYPIVTRHP